MKPCKCGMPIYDEPEQPSDKCYDCTLKSLRTAVDKRLFTGTVLYKDKPNIVGNSEL